MVNQLTDNGAVIGYQPNLSYKKDIDNRYNTENINVNEENIPEYHSSALVYLAKYTPSNTLNALDFAGNNLELLIKDLAGKFETGEYGNFSNINSLMMAIETQDDAYINDFVDYHSHNIIGSIIPELMKAIYSSSKRINSLKSTMKYLYYGDSNIQTAKTSDIDTKNIRDLAKLEMTDNYWKIDYMKVCLDALFNKNAEYFAYDINRACINLTNVVNSPETTEISSKIDRNFLEKLYSDLNFGLDLRHKNFDSQQNIEILPKTIYNYYYVRQDLQNLYDILENSSSSYLKNKADGYYQDAISAIENISKMLVGNKIYIDQLSVQEVDKYLIMNTYKKVISDFS